ncbi:MAG: hypothetical protein NWF03_06470, partial [Candidatus Bathyarchaeota archaeon]|nr:hypothetical protein [Candidatus Bathyarchaeota archaeon]
GVFFSFLSFTHANPEVDELADPEAWILSYASTFGINVLTTPLNGADVSTDVHLYNITFTEDTFWFPWNTRTYSYESDDEGFWFWKFKYEIQETPNTRVLAWVNGEQSYPNAFIVENKNGEGYTYMVNTRNAHSLPDGVLTDVLVDFLNFLCSYFVRPLTYVPYPETEYWLSQGQSDRAVYLIHDNSTETYTFQYYLRALEAGLVPGAEYLVFDYFNREFIGFVDDWMVSLNVTLHSNEGKVFVFLEDDNKPQVIYSDALLDSATLSGTRQLDITIEGVPDTTNTTTVYCSDFGQPKYILGLPYEVSQIYDQTNKFLTIVTDSDISVGWDNTTAYSVVSSTAPLSGVTWNQSLGTLTLSANGTIGQQATVEIETGDKLPDYVKVNGVELSTWSHDETTGIVTARFSFPAQETQLTLGFKAIGVDQTVVSNERADVGSVQTVCVHVAWMRDASDVEGATVTVDNVEYVTNSTGWTSFEVSQDSVSRTVYGVNKVEYNSVSDFAKAANDPQIIWDQINITNLKAFDDIVPAGSPQTVWLTAEYQYDYTRFDGSKGTIYFNGEPMTYSEQNSRWEYNITSNEAGPKMYEVTSVDDTVYGLSAVCSQANNLTVTWDKVEITDVEYETPALGKVKMKIHVEFSYTKNPVTGATVVVNDVKCTETEQGVYAYEVDDWGPVPTFLVKVEYPNFGVTTKTVSDIQALNSLMYLVFGLAIVVIIVFVIKRKKGTKQHEPET